MFLIAIYGLVAFLLVLLLRGASLIISENLNLEREEISSYECGFEHVSYSRLPFSFRYFFLTLVFLIFDMEVVFLLFLPGNFVRVVSSSFLLVSSFLFVVILAFSLIYE